MTFNNTVYDWTALENTPNSMWISVALYKKLTEFDPRYPVDFVVTVRGRVSGTGWLGWVGMRVVLQDIELLGGTWLMPCKHPAPICRLMSCALPTSS